jgi:hypothetical protein
MSYLLLVVLGMSEASLSGVCVCVLPFFLVLKMTTALWKMRTAAAHQAGRYQGRQDAMRIRARRVYLTYWIYFWPVLEQPGPTHMQKPLGL